MRAWACKSRTFQGAKLDRISYSNAPKSLLCYIDEATALSTALVNLRLARTSASPCPWPLEFGEHVVETMKIIILRCSDFEFMTSVNH